MKRCLNSHILHILLLIATCSPLLSNAQRLFSASAQDSVSLCNKICLFPDRLFSSIEKRTKRMEERLERTTQRYLRSIASQERRALRRLQQKDSACCNAFINGKQFYGDLLSKSDVTVNQRKHRQYLRGLDSVKTAFAFLSQNAPIKSELGGNFSRALHQYQAVQQKMDKSSLIQQMVIERQQMLQQRMSQLGYKKIISKYQQQVYYYREQMQSYKDLLNDPKMLEATIIKYVSGLPAFENFFSKYSELASLFRLPQQDAPDNFSLEGLQTRAMLTAELQQRFGSGVQATQYVSNGLGSAQGALAGMKNKLQQLGSSGSDMDMPDFRPNSQKTKSLFDRLEYSVNIQSVKSQLFFPSRTDIGVGIGYKINDKFIVGVGSSYKMGWGRNIQHMSISHQGLALRSFIDFNLKKSFWLTGGYEMNYLSQFRSFEELKQYSSWQRSGLIGLSKKISLKNKFLKSTKVQLLWDFLSYQQIPRPQPIIYRLAYSF